MSHVLTHRAGHTLDLIITRSSESTVTHVFVSDPGLSDHSAVRCHLQISKPPPIQIYLIELGVNK